MRQRSRNLVKRKTQETRNENNENIRRKKGKREGEGNSRENKRTRENSNFDGGEEIQIFVYKGYFCNFDGLHSPPYRGK